MPRYIVWGSELSPYTLKLRALLTAAAVPYRDLPADGSRWENLRCIRLIERGKRSRSIERWPRLDPLDEFPLVPFLIVDERRVLYDSSALAAWLDHTHPSPRGPLVPDDPALGFVAQLIDEAFDEIGLYLVHHARWVTSARTNDAGARLAREFARVIPPFTEGAFGRRFARRQVRRLPYLFSVAPPGLAIGTLPPELTPPARDGFPPTHALLDELRGAALDAIEAVLTKQPYLLGRRFTVADASVYGELGMNLKDPTAAEDMRRRAPTTFRWLCDIRDGAHAGSSGPLVLADALRPLLALIDRTFVPLMAQNEAAFDRGRALYDGVLLGQPFRAAAKSFQVRVWRDVRAAWSALDAEARSWVRQVLPSTSIDGGG